MLRSFLREDGHDWQAVQLQDGAIPPPLDDFEALWVMGGPMDVWETEAHPWLVEEKALIRDAVAARGMPFLGLCLGHQLLAEALGGTCRTSQTPEIGVLDVQLTEEGANGVLFDAIPERFPALQWHGAEIRQLPSGARCLATSPACAVQAMQWGPRAFSAQFHVEVEQDTVANWAAIPAYAASLEAAFGPAGVDTLAAECALQMPSFNAVAERLYINWLQTAAHT